MAEIIENIHGRRLIKVSTDDLISLVKEYQSVVCCKKNYKELRVALDERNFFLPEDC